MENKNNSGKQQSFFESLSKGGNGEQIIKFGTPILSILIIGGVILSLGQFITNAQTPSEADIQATIDAIVAPTLNAATGLSPDGAQVEEISNNDPFISNGISRSANPITIIPDRARSGIDFYTVQPGDSIYSIADIYNLEPTTIFWGNFEALEDNPRELTIDAVLNILPTDGIYYRYNTGESLNLIASNFKANVQDIIEWPGNKLDPYETDPDNPEIADGTWLIIPDGWRETPDWGPPAITRENPAVAAYYGDGACGAIYEGPVGNGTFIWPTPGTYISGYDYDPNLHPGIDIAGAEGNAIWAIDSGVIVYAGNTTSGYGLLVVVDHGNGWQSAYAHLSAIFVGCGGSVYRGDKIAALGNTGRSTGAHLHFELRSAVFGKVNPWSYLILP